MERRINKVLALFATVASLLTAPPSRADTSADDSAQVNSTSWQLALNAAHFHGGASTSGSPAASATSVNATVRGQLSLLSMWFSRSRLVDQWAIEFGMGGSDNDDPLVHFDFQYRLEGGLHGVLQLGPRVEVTARALALIQGDVARLHTNSSGAYTSILLAPGVRVGSVFVEGGPELEWKNTGTGFLVAGWYRFAPHARYVRDVGFWLEHHAGFMSGRDMSDTIAGLTFGSH